ncbi:MAG: O-antigen ligase family protein [Bacteroidota bacterium]|nr:O-antigen ligase family protein [Bacteroidota bacterium]MDX5427135.1 O-antigen ligase family protein [Bacteroidota bacterium]MDX5447584.1 O-antigen ligase family protein [Bacteroidota bacterium]MDX5505102.1 O-antigen ligase family protein [Bacteroidota bacterium]
MSLGKYSDRILIYLLIGIFGALTFFGISKVMILFIFFDSLFTREGRKRMRGVFSTRLFWWSFVFFLLYFLSGIYTKNMGDWLFQVESKSLFFFGTVAMMVARPEWKRHEGRFLKWLITITTAGILFSLGQAIYRIIDTNQWSRNFPNGAFDSWYLSYTALAENINHPSYYSFLVVASICALFALKERAQKPWPIRYTLPLGTILFVFLIMLQARMVILAFFGILAITVIIWLFKRRSPFRWAALLFPIASLIAFTFIPSESLGRFGDLKGLDYDLKDPDHSHFNGFTIRLAEWTCTWDVIQANPFIGVGGGDVTDELVKAYEKRGFVIGVERRYNPHNQYLQSWVAIGITGLAWLILTAILFMRVGFRRWDLPLWIWSGTFFISMLAESVLEREAGLVHLFFIGGLFLFGGEKKETQEKSKE